MLNYIPIVGWLIAMVFAFVMAIPLFFIWNSLAPEYFTGLPDAYKHVPFFDVVLFCWLLPILKTLIFRASVSFPSKK